MALPLITKSEFVSRVIEMLEEWGYDLSKTNVSAVVDAIEEVTKNGINECERIKIGNILTIEPKIRKAQKKRMGRNPQTGEPVEVSAKPASVRVAARVLKPLKESAPTTNLLKRRSS